ncbi:DUF4410 domain-containing protein [Burkholderia ubonensis]|uniref:DUF4410 domain-containing protein n=1 Tax=Burkholderia ubonensis TaxID=101571 RepID=UPI0007C79E11|nr:DUF4410 domain-containing protein [Burkholderia ubonensis]
MNTLLPPRSFITACLALVTSACFAAPSDLPPCRSAAPVVYVSDFVLDAPPQKNDSASRGPIRGLLRDRLLRRHDDPEVQAREMTSLMAETLTEDLKQSGVDARRLPPSAPLPASGWNVHGEFLSIDEGDTAKRAIIGFGAGRGDVQIAVAVDDLASPGQLSVQDVTTRSGNRMPGAIVKLNPYVVAAKFVLAERDRQKAVKNAAKQVANTVVQRVRGAARTECTFSGSARADPAR